MLEVFRFLMVNLMDKTNQINSITVQYPSQIV